MNKIKIEKAIEKLYNINANISAITFIYKQRFSLEEQSILNRRLGEVIKQLREGVE